MKKMMIKRIKITLEELSQQKQHIEKKENKNCFDLLNLQAIENTTKTLLKKVEAVK